MSNFNISNTCIFSPKPFAGFDPISQITPATFEIPALGAFTLCQTNFEGCHLEVWMPTDLKDHCLSFGGRAIPMNWQSPGPV